MLVLIPDGMCMLACATSCQARGASLSYIPSEEWYSESSPRKQLSHATKKHMEAEIDALSSHSSDLDVWEDSDPNGKTPEDIVAWCAQYERGNKREMRGTEGIFIVQALNLAYTDVLLAVIRATAASVSTQQILAFKRSQGYALRLVAGGVDSDNTSSEAEQGAVLNDTGALLASITKQLFLDLVTLRTSSPGHAEDPYAGIGGATARQAVTAEQVTSHRSATAHQFLQGAATHPSSLRCKVTFLQSPSPPWRRHRPTLVTPQPSKVQYSFTQNMLYMALSLSHRQIEHHMLAVLGRFRSRRILPSLNCLSRPCPSWKRPSPARILSPQTRTTNNVWRCGALQ
jgi:hypothetical protein